MGSDVDAVAKSGRLFHTRAAATGKARSPTVDSRDGGTTRAGADAERRRRRVPRSATRRPRYFLSVSVSACLSQVVVLLKRLNVGLRKQHHTIAQDFRFLTPKLSAKFDRDQPLRGRQMQVKWVEIGELRLPTGCISKTVQDRRTVSIKLD